MNSTLQCLRKVPELKDALISVAGRPGNTQEAQLASAAGNLFKSMDQAKEAQPPFLFLTKLHAAYPQFAEKGQGGGLMQHDAEECWNAVLMSLARTLPKSQGGGDNAGQPSQENSLVSELFQGEMETRFKCQESEAEPEVVKLERFQKLTCNIDAKVSERYRDGVLCVSFKLIQTSS